MRAGLELLSSWEELGSGWTLLACQTPSRAPAAIAWALGQVPVSGSRPKGLFLTVSLGFSEELCQMENQWGGKKKGGEEKNQTLAPKQNRSAWVNTSQPTGGREGEIPQASSTPFLLPAVPVYSKQADKDSRLAPGKEQRVNTTLGGSFCKPLWSRIKKHV